MRGMWAMAAGVSWIVWSYPFLSRIFRARRRGPRESITAPAARIGMALEATAVFLAFGHRLPRGSAPGAERLVPALLLGLVAIVMAFAAVRHLGKQWRLEAGLYRDHELVRMGPYAVVRHPIYASLLAMLLATLLVLTPWRWMPICLGIYILGTEIRVRAEEKLLAWRFGEEFRQYQSKVPAYVPFVR